MQGSLLVIKISKIKSVKSCKDKWHIHLQKVAERKIIIKTNLIII